MRNTDYDASGIYGEFLKVQVMGQFEIFGYNGSQIFPFNCPTIIFASR